MSFISYKRVNGEIQLDIPRQSDKQIKPAKSFFKGLKEKLFHKGEDRMVRADEVNVEKEYNRIVKPVNPNMEDPFASGEKWLEDLGIGPNNKNRA